MWQNTFLKMRQVFRLAKERLVLLKEQSFCVYGPRVLGDFGKLSSVRLENLIAQVFSCVISVPLGPESLTCFCNDSSLHNP